MIFLMAVELGLTPPPQGQNSNMLLQFLPLALIFLIFYFLLIRPARVKQRNLQAMLATHLADPAAVRNFGVPGLGLKRGLSEDIVQLRIAENVKVEFSKSAVVSVVDRKE